MNDVLVAVDEELQVIDEPKDATVCLGMDVPVLIQDDARARQFLKHDSQPLRRRNGGTVEADGLDRVARIT